MKRSRSGLGSWFVIAIAFAVLFCCVAVIPVHAAEPSARNIDSGWQFRAVANVDRADVKEWHPAQVPGVVQTDLLNSKLIPEPFDRDNEFRTCNGLGWPTGSIKLRFRWMPRHWRMIMLTWFLTGWIRSRTST